MDRKTVYAFMIAVLIAGCAPLVSKESKSEPVQEYYLVSTGIAALNVWLPSSIVLDAGKQARLIVENQADTAHGFSIDELGVREVIQPKEIKIITIEPEKPGIYRFYCHLHGMKHLGGSIMVR